MTFEEYTAKAEYQERAQNLAQKRRKATKRMLIFGLPLFILGVAVIVCADAVEYFNENLWWIGLIGAALVIAGFVAGGAVNAFQAFVGSKVYIDFARDIFEAEELFSKEKLLPYLEGYPREGEINVFFDCKSMENKLLLSPDGKEWAELDTTAFYGSLCEADVCGMLFLAFVERLQREEARGITPVAINFISLKAHEKIKWKEDEIVRIWKKGKITLTGKSAYKRLLKVREN